MNLEMCFFSASLLPFCGLSCDLIAPPKFFAYIVMFTVRLIGFQLANQMEEVVSRCRERLFALGERMQPMVVLVGELGDISSAYVVLDDARWQVQTALKAVDICFKAFCVLHAQYPVESNVWMLLQRLVYGFCTKWDVVSPTVNAVITDLSS